MNKYLCYVTGADSIGYSFMQNVVSLAQKGATLQEDKIPAMRFPHSAFMYFETEELMEDKPGFRFQIIDIQYTKEHLESLPIETMRHLVAEKGVKGRDKTKMIKQYLAACESGKNVDEDSAEAEDE
jgi:hypothetical protein